MVIRIYGLITILVMSSFFVAAQGKRNASAQWEADADTLVSHQDYEGAIPLYTKILAASKLKTDADFSVLHKRAFSYYGAGRFNEALLDVNQYLQRFPDDQQTKLLRVYIYQELGKVEEQLEGLNAFLIQSPGNPDLLRWRASVLMESERYAEAQQDIRVLLSYQADPGLKAYLGLSYYYMNNLDSALLIFDQLIVSDPAFIESYLYAGSIGLEEEAYDLSLHYLNKGLAQDPANSTLMFYKGIALVEKDEIEAGCRCLTKAFTTGADDAADYLKEYCYGVE